MNAMARCRVLAVFLLFAPAQPASAAEGGPVTTIRLLTVGNSFADNMLRFLPGLAEAAGLDLTVGRANFTGCSLQKHAESASAGVALYPTAPGKPERTLQQALEAERWDIITIQQASRLSDDWTTYQPWAGSLVDQIRRHAPQAEVVIHQTWAYRHDDPKFRDGSTPAQMHAAVRSNYHRLARDLGLRVIPVGDAFHLAASTPEWTYRRDENFDHRNPPEGAVPDQPGSLHAGWGWRRSKAENPLRFNLDAHHANIFGAYLAGCVMLRFLTGHSPVGNAFVPEGISKEQAASLQRLAEMAASSAEPSDP